jgi:hypothetical protein
MRREEKEKDEDFLESEEGKGGGAGCAAAFAWNALAPAFLPSKRISSFLIFSTVLPSK